MMAARSVQTPLAATASLEAASYAIALASASPATNATSSGLARQLIGVMMTPANWQAQCRVAASHRFCSRVTR